MCPILFKALLENKNKIKYNPYKSEIFSMGMVLLETALLKPVKVFYDIEKRRFNQKTFMIYFEEFMQIYGDHDLLREVMIKILQLN